MIVESRVDRQISRRVPWLLVLLVGCPATVPQGRYEADLAAQKRDYEARLLAVDAERGRIEASRAASQTQWRAAQLELQQRIAAADRALVAKAGVAALIAHGRGPTPDLAARGSAISAAAGSARVTVGGDSTTDPVAANDPPRGADEAGAAPAGGLVVAFAAGALFEPGADVLAESAGPLLEALAVASLSAPAHRVRVSISLAPDPMGENTEVPVGTSPATGERSGATAAAPAVQSEAPKVTTGGSRAWSRARTRIAALRGALVALGVDPSLLCAGVDPAALVDTSTTAEGAVGVRFELYPLLRFSAEPSMKRR